jgi:KaiC/GvpD/RAD55 family RecA-like ATPase
LVLKVYIASYAIYKQHLKEDPKMTDQCKRCPSGIPGLDEMIQGGFPRQRSILLSGASGSGKTTLAVQYLYRGITDYNEPGIFICLEQDPKELKSDMLDYGFDLQKAEYEGKLIIIDASLSRVGMTKMDGLIAAGTFKEQPEGSMSILPDEFNIEKILALVEEKAKKIGATRAVFDSLPALDFLIDEESEAKIKHRLRELLITINYRLKSAGLTSLLVTETIEEERTTVHAVESYVADGTIAMTINEALDDRTIKIKKMRHTRHSLKPRMFEFTEKGIQIKSPPADSGIKTYFK